MHLTCFVLSVAPLILHVLHAMQSYSVQLAEVRSYFDHGDLHLGYRRLLDAAMETGSLDAYRETLDFSNWYAGRMDGPDDGTLVPRVNSLLETLANLHVQTKREAPVIKMEARGIGKKYRKGSFAISPMDITVYPSEIIGLVGENGNGKTTLLRLLYGDLEPDKGSIHYHFRTNASLYDTRSKIAFIPQRPDPWYGSLVDNLQLASSFTGLYGESNLLHTEMMIARMGLRPFRNHNWNSISSGYKMRFELARTLLRNPELLLLDEPLANLDILAQQIILEDLRFLARSERKPLSIVLSSQQLYEVEKVSDQVIFLQNGVAQYQDASRANRNENALVLELETEASRETLQTLFAAWHLEKISFNGGVYLLYFPVSTALPAILQVLGENDIPVKYLRDISASSRRFFDA